MKHEKTFEAISKLKDIEFELHRLKNALEMANKALDVPPKREWQWLSWEEVDECFKITPDQYLPAQIYKRIKAKLMEKNT